MKTTPKRAKHAQPARRSPLSPLPAVRLNQKTGCGPSTLNSPPSTGALPARGSVSRSMAEDRDVLGRAPRVLAARVAAGNNPALNRHPDVRRQRAEAPERVAPVASPLLWSFGTPVSTGYYIRHGRIYGPKMSGLFFITNGYIYGPMNSGQYCLVNGYIFGPRKSGWFFIQHDYFYGPNANVPWLEN